MKVVAAENRRVESKTISFLLAALVVFTMGSPSLATTYYKIGNDGGGQSSFAGNVNDSIGWATSADATATTSFSAAEMAASDFVVNNNALTLRLPTADDNAITFGGRSLTLTGNATLALKKKNNGGNRDVTIAALAVSGSGVVNHAQGASQFTLKGAISLAADSNLRVGLGTDSADNGDCRRLVIDSILTGGETTAINITGGGGAANSASLTLNSVGGFLGTMTSTIDSPNFSLLINGAFGGTITAFPDSTKAVVIDYDGLPAATGLRVASTTIPAALKTKLTLYSATTDFMQDRLPLVTFPAGTDVDPAEFTLKHATGATGTATAFPHLTVVTNADDTVTLAVNATVPMYAKMVKGEGDVYAWHFYGCGWDDVTATCGLSVPDSTIKVYVTSTEEVAPILANPGTPAGYRIGSLSADADLTSLSPLAIEAGSEIDLNGHALTIPGSVLDALKTSTKNLVNNGTFEAEPISDNAYEKNIVITGWTKSDSSNIGLMRKRPAELYAQRNDNTTWCYITKNDYISQTITVPEDTTYLFSLKVANKNYLKSNKQAYDASPGNLQIDGANVLTWSRGDAETRTISGGIQTLTAGSHTLKISCTSGSGVGIDNVTMSYLPPTATITSSAAGGELHVNVPSDVVMTNSAVNISGHVKLVKEGPGTFVSCRRDLYYDGGNEIVEGKLMTAEGNGSNRDWAPRYRPLGEKAKTITVRKDGILDIAGNYEYGDYPIVLDGGLLRSGTVNDGNIAQVTNNTWGGIGKLSLTTNSTFYLRSNTVFRGWDSEQINLNGHELLFDMSVNDKRLYMAKDMTNGTIRLSPADSSKNRGFIIYNRDVDARTVDVIDEIGCISPVTTFSVRSYTATSPSGNSYWSGTGRMRVYGTFTPETDYFYGCTMMDGSTIDLSGRSDTWSTTGAYNCGRRTVDFADNATIYVKLGNRHRFSGPVIGWTTRPSNLSGLTFKRAEDNAKMVKKDNGVYVTPGLIIIVQ